jgi:hypothetical protein
MLYDTEKFPLFRNSMKTLWLGEHGSYPGGFFGSPLPIPATKTRSFTPASKNRSPGTPVARRLSPDDTFIGASKMPRSFAALRMTALRWRRSFRFGRFKVGMTILTVAISISSKEKIG